MLQPDKQQSGNLLYVAGNYISYEYLLGHLLWRIIGETGLIHIDQLTEMESIVLGRVVRKKYNVTPSFSPPVMEAELNILSSGIDKIVGHIKNLHDQTQRYHAIVEQNKHSTPGPHSQLNIPCNENNKYKSSRCIDRPIDEIGLSRRTARLLKSVGINTLEQLGKCSLPGLRRQARFGVKTIHEIETVLLKYGTAPAGNY